MFWNGSTANEGLSGSVSAGEVDVTGSGSFAAGIACARQLASFHSTRKARMGALGVLESEFASRA